MRLVLRLAALISLLALCGAAGASAARLQLVGNFSQPIFVTSAPGNADELFVVEREGRVMRLADGTVTTFADITGLVSCCTSERGLLSIALAPDFDASGRFFAAYAGEASAGGTEGDIHVDAFRHAAGVLVREPILSIGHADNPNHNGGQLQIGPDGYLYISTGDGGGGGDPLESGQSLDTLLGKILRLEPRPGAQPEIWSYGLRNPWRFSFDRETGDMVVADVGQGAREEIDFAPSLGPGTVGGKGSNYGWSCREGFIAYSDPAENCAGVTGFTDPVFDYPHADPEDGSAHGCSITGGYVVRDKSLGDLYGRYVYADFCVGQIRSLVLPTTAGGLAGGDRSEGLNVSNPTSFGEDSCGRIYVTSAAGAVYRFEGESPAACPTRRSAPVAGALGSPVKMKPGRVRVSLHASRHRDGKALRVLLTARVRPCTGMAGEIVRLNRGGEKLAGKRLDRSCTTRFRLRVSHASTFRAVLPAGDYRSQVRTIALAKPRP